MRELWWLACGSFDRDVEGWAFIAAAFGAVLTARQRTDLHPLRRMEEPPPTAEDKAAEAALGWAMVGGYFRQNGG